MLRCPSGVENLLRYQDMHALQLLFSLVAKSPTERKNKIKGSSTKSLKLGLGAYTTLALQEVCCPHLLSFSFSFFFLQRISLYSGLGSNI